MLLDTRSLPADLTASEPPAGGFDAPLSPPRAHDWAGEIPLTPGADLWVFGYGSLMWHPGFAHVEQQPAVLKGYHRRFCVASHRYRGTPDRPGLVLGLDRGGTCRGIAFRVAAPQVPDALDYLWDREMISRVYRPKQVPVRMACGRRAEAWTFVVDRGHCQYCACLDLDVTAERIAASAGERGPNLDYLANTVAHLESMGMHDRALRSLLDAVRRRIQAD